MSLIKPSEKIAIVAARDAANATASVTVYTNYTDWTDVSKFQQYMAIVHVGNINSVGVVSAKWRQATSNTGAGVKDVTTFTNTITNLTATDDNKQVIINLPSVSLLDTAGGFKFLALGLKYTAQAVIGALILGLEPNYGPANDHDVASVDEVVG